MTKNYWIVEADESSGGKDGDCHNCNPEWACHEANHGNGLCPLSNARKAVKVIRHGVDGYKLELNRNEIKLNGKPVTLFAVETTEDKTP